MTLSGLRRITLKLFGSRSGRGVTSSGRTTSFPPGYSRSICPVNMSDLSREGSIGRQQIDIMAGMMERKYDYDALEEELLRERAEGT